MKSMIWMLLFAAIVYGGYKIAGPYLIAQGSLGSSAQNAPAPSPTTTSPAPQPTAAPAAAPAPVASMIPASTATSQPTSSLDAAPPPATIPSQPSNPAATAPIHITCATKVAAYDPNSPLQQIGWFIAGSDLEVSDCPQITGMKSIHFKDPSGQVIHAISFEKDLYRTADEVAAATTTQPKPVVEMPKPLNYKPRKWVGEPNWHSVYDDPNHKMMTDKHGNQK